MVMYIRTSITLLSMVIIAINGADNLALSSAGARCTVGINRQPTMYDCRAAIDGTLAPYTPPPRDAWMLISLTAVAKVTHVDLLFASSVTNDVEIQLKLSAGADPDQYERFNIIGLPVGMYHQPFSFRQPVVTNYVTLSWRTAQMPTIIDVRVYGITQGSSTIVPSTTQCDNFQESACGYTTDNDMMSTMYLTSGTTLQMQFDVQESLTHVAFYSTQQRSETVIVPIMLTVDDRHNSFNQTVDVDFRNQGRNQHATWQIVHLPEPYLVPSMVTVVYHGGQSVTLSEITFFHIDQGHNIPPTVPPLGISIGNIQTLNTVYLGKVPTTTASTSQTTAHYDQTDTTDDILQDLIVTTDDRPHEAITTQENIKTSVVPNTPEQVTITTDQPRYMETLSVINHITTEQIGDKGTFLPGKLSLGTDETPITQGAEYVRTSLPWWFWYLIIGVAVLIIVLVVILIVMLTRMRRKSYRPRNRRPHVTLRSVSQTSHALSVVTPTRGYFHLTLNSQSSMPEPYSGVSPFNTTTFARGYKKPEESNDYVDCNERNSALESNERNSAIESERTQTTSSISPSRGREEVESHITEFELSDDCFEP